MKVSMFLFGVFSTLGSAALTLLLFAMDYSATGLHMLPLGVLAWTLWEVVAYAQARKDGEVFEPRLNAFSVALLALAQAAATLILSSFFTGGLGAGWLYGQSFPAGLVASFLGFMFGYGTLLLYFKRRSRLGMMQSCQDHWAQHAA